MHEPNAFRRLIALGSVLVLVVGCGIAGQSPTPVGSSTPAATAAAGTATPSTGTPGASGTPGATSTSPAETGSPDASATPGASDVPATPAPTLAGQLTWANWPLYIDIDEETGGYPTLEAFQQQTGVAVAYQEDINDNSEFFGRIQPDLAAGNPTGYDIITPSDWMVARLIRLGYVQPLDKSLLPNFEANVLDVFRDPWYDPGNQYSIPWQAGIVGIGYNPTLTGREITTFDDLLDPAFAGRVGMFSEMIDTMSMALLSNGVAPEDATPEDVQARPTSC